MMRLPIFAALLSGALLCATGLSAQTAAPLSAEQVAKVKEHVAKEKRVPGAVPAGYSVAIGAAVPENLELYPVPSEVGAAGYRYAVIGNQIVLVAPGGRQIYQVWGIGY